MSMTAEEYQRKCDQDTIEFYKMMLKIKDEEIWELRGEVERLVGHKIWIREGVNEQ